MDKEKYIFRKSLDKSQEEYFYGYLEEGLEKQYTEKLIDIKLYDKLNWYLIKQWSNKEKFLYPDLFMNGDKYRWGNGCRFPKGPNIGGYFVDINFSEDMLEDNNE
jgi:hypothetical protein